MKNLSKIFTISTLLLPGFAFSATFDSLLTTANSLIDKIIPVIMGIAFAYFLWGIVKYIMASADDIAGKGIAKTVMVNGIIALFVMTAVWGIVAVVTATLGIGGNTTVQIHGLP